MAGERKRVDKRKLVIRIICLVLALFMVITALSYTLIMVLAS